MANLTSLYTTAPLSLRLRPESPYGEGASKSRSCMVSSELEEALERHALRVAVDVEGGAAQEGGEGDAAVAREIDGETGGRGDRRDDADARRQAPSRQSRRRGGR